MKNLILISIIFLSARCSAQHVYFNNRVGMSCVQLDTQYVSYVYGNPMLTDLCFKPLGGGTFDTTLRIGLNYQYNLFYHYIASDSVTIQYTALLPGDPTYQIIAPNATYTFGWAIVSLIDSIVKNAGVNVSIKR